MLYRETGQFKTTYVADQAIFPILQDRIGLWLILAVAFVAGFFLDWLEISLIFLPLVAPVVRTLGYDPVWFVVVFAVMLQTSFLTPPVGFSLFYVKGGVAWAENTYRGSIDSLLGVGVSGDEVRSGWAVGVGYEYAFRSNWSTRLEYLFLDFGSENVTLNGPAGASKSSAGRAPAKGPSSPVPSGK